MSEQKHSYTFEDLIECAKGRLFGPGNAQLPLPPMLMFDRIVKIDDKGGRYGKGEIVAELDVKPDLWFFACHFKGDPVMPGCLPLDALWQLLGFFLGWMKAPGRGRALGVGEVKFTGMIVPTVRKLTYHVHLKRVMLRKLALGIADGDVHADGQQVYEVSGLKVGLVQDAAVAAAAGYMKRVVVTGLGVVSSIGNNAAEVTRSLRDGKSGIEFVPQYRELGFRSQVAGTLKMNVDELVDRRLRRFMGDGAAFAYLAMKEAIADAGLGDAEISNERTGVVAGSGGPTTGAIVQAALITKEKGPKKVGPFMVPKAMSSTVSANLATAYKIKGLSYSISSACSTSAHCIGNAVECIQLGKADRMFAGGGEELDWTLSVLFDAMGAMSAKYNDTPERASRAYDKDRDGFVISGGGGILVLEDLEVAKARGAKIYAEIIGYGATSDGADMVAPSGEGAVRCMKLAMDGFPGAARRNAPVDYINSHGTSTPVGDITELDAIRAAFGNNKLPSVSSTKSLTGHSQGATGAHEAVYSLLMLKEDFVAASANIETLDPGAGDYPIARQRIDNAGLETVMSNSFGFGGTNACLVFSRYNH